LAEALRLSFIPINPVNVQTFGSTKALPTMSSADIAMDGMYAGNAGAIACLLPCDH
jgi:hypothetical protein